VEGALFSTSSYDTSLAALNSKLASSAPRGMAPPSLLPSSQANPPSGRTHAIVPTTPQKLPQQASLEDKNVFAIYVSYYIKVKLTLSSMGGEVTLKLPFILGDIEIGSDSSKKLQVNNSNNLHLNDHVIVNEIRRPDFNRSDSTTDSTKDSKCPEKADDKLFSRNSSINCKSLDYDDSDILPNIGSKSINFEEEMDFINRKLNELQRSNSSKLSRSDSSRSNLNEDEYKMQETSVIKAQVHCQTDKSADSDT
jgi:hypothetical protein